ncbi:hypothetical protein, partial [Bacillus thuringiensis]|uniref:hypothetical protein n=1 Tax=Bacillus thuringiensis TaxID=1428 RepID=UPI003BFA7025
KQLNHLKNKPQTLLARLNPPKPHNNINHPISPFDSNSPKPPLTPIQHKPLQLHPQPQPTAELYNKQNSLHHQFPTLNKNSPLHHQLPPIINQYHK